MNFFRKTNRLHRNIIVFSLSVLSFLTALYFISPRPVYSTLTDLGTLEAGEQHEFTWAIKNSGVLPLTINEIVTDCGCIAEVKKGSVMNVSGGERKEIKFSIYVEHNRPVLETKIVARTNAWTESVITTGVTAKPIVRARLIPSQLIILPNDMPYDGIVFERKLKFSLVQPGVLKQLHCEVDELFVRCSTQIIDEMNAEVTLNLLKPTPKGELNIPITIHYELANTTKSHLTLLVRGSFGGQKETYPSILHCGARDKDTFSIKNSKLNKASSRIVLIRSAVNLSVSINQPGELIVQRQKGFGLKRTTDGMIYIYLRDGKELLSVPVFYD